MVGACTSGGATTTTDTRGPIVTTPTTPATTPTTAVVATPSAAGPLIVWVSSEAVADAVIAQGAAYTAATGVEVFVWTIFSAPDDDRLFLDELLAGELGGADPLAGPGGEELPEQFRRAPDIFIGPHTWLEELAEAGLADPVPLPDGLPGGVVPAVTLRGFPIGVPVALDTVVQFRNPALLAARPGDTADVACAAEVACLLLPGDGDPDIHYPFLVAGGGYVFADHAEFGFDAGDVGVDTPPAIVSVVVLEAMIEGGGVATAGDREDARARFAAGEAALIWDGAAAVGALGTAVIEPLPTIAQNAPVAVVRVTAAWVNAAGTFKTEAAEFAGGYLGSVDGSTTIARALGMIPVWPDAATDVERLFIDAADAGDPVPYIREAIVAWEALARAFASIHDGASAGTALTDAADTIRFQP